MSKANHRSEKSPSVPPAKAAPSSASTAKTPPAPEPTGSMFRPVDWISALLTTVLVMVGYMMTIAPNVTLEDSGELAVAAQYAGVPHPPGYPVWTLYTWLFTTFLPFNNIAWRAGVASAFAGALSCGLIALIVSRGSSMMIEGLADLRSISKRLETALCLVAGFVGGMLMGFNGFFWSQAVIVEVYTLSVLSLVVTILFLMRWVYTPSKLRYLYAALFVFGICFTNHQTLLVAAMGIEITVAAVNRKLGRALFFGNSVIYGFVLILKAKSGISSFDGNPPLFVIFNLIGIGSLYAFFWLGASLRVGTKVTTTLVHFALNLILLIQWSKGQLSESAFPLVMLFWNVGVVGVAYGMMVSTKSAEKVMTSWKEEWLPIIMMGVLFVLGAALYLFMPIASMSNPPLNWGYPRTAEGFVHALTRGQYEKANPSNLINDPMRFFSQIWMYSQGVIDEFNLGYVLIGLVPFAVVFYWRMKREELIALLFCSGLYLMVALGVVIIDFNVSKLKFTEFFTMNLPGIAGIGAGLVLLWIALTPMVVKSHAQKREAAWMAGLTSIYLFLALLLLILLNPSLDRQSRELNRVFFTSSHVIIAISIGLGISLLGAVLAVFHAQLRKWLLGAAAVICFIAFYHLAVIYGPSGADAYTDWRSILFGLNATHDYTARFTTIFSLALAVAFLIAVGFLRGRVMFLVLIPLFAVMPVRSFTSHWWDNEQRGHLFGYWFGHDMFTPPFKGKDGKPIYPEMDRDTVLFGGTDPGRFNPTYMIFSESFTPREDRQAEDLDFDRRDVYLITQNALADATYLAYIRAHYNRSAQVDPGFFEESKFTSWLGPVARLLDKTFLNLGDWIEKERRVSTSWFTPADFTNVTALVTRLQPGANQDAVSKFVYAALTPATQQLLAGGNEAALKKALARDLNVLLERELKDKGNPEFASTPRPLYEANRFAAVKLTPRTQRFIRQNPQSHTRIRLNRILLEEAYPDAIAKSIGGVYPDLEILTPNREDSERCFTEYVTDAQRRKQHDMTFPNEPPQIKPGEVVVVDNGRVQVSGQIAVMAINGLLTKVIFDKNPDHAFYVEESFPLDWMFPHLTPYGIILKINRQPLAVLPPEVFERDHEFWTQYSTRTIGNWINYETPVKQICEWAEKVYMRRDLRGFEGDPKFIRDDNAQKAFSKLRSAIGGVYAWRLGMASGVPTPAGFVTRNEADRQRLIREADFAFKQAFAFCPFSPEAVFRYAQFLFGVNRADDALLIAETCFKLDPENASIARLLQDIRRMRPLQGDEAEWRKDTNNFQIGFRFASTLMQQRRQAEAVAVLDQLGANPNADAQVLVSVAEAFRQMGEWAHIEAPMKRLTSLMAESPEAWFDLAGVQAMTGKPDDALKSLEQAVKFNAQRREQQPGARDLIPMVQGDPRFNAIRSHPTYLKLIPAAPAPAAAPGATTAPAIPTPVQLPQGAKK
jgi:thioredoxin-like negative regulator of GroEL